MTRKTVLVTGGAGFIGSNIARHLAKNGYDVTICDRFQHTEKWRNLSSTQIHALVMPEALAQKLESERFDVVVHMGAISATTETDVDLIVRTNIELSSILMDYCVRQQSQFIYASSAATYGSGELGFDDDDSLPALSRLRPLNAYGWSKAVFDQIVARRRDAGGALPPQWAGLKFFNVYGPNEYHKEDMRSVVHKVYGQILSGAPVTLFKSHRAGVADGEQKRDFVYVDDCVSVVDWLISTPAVSGIFNVGSAHARSFRELAFAVFSALGQEPRLRFVEMPQALRARYQYFTQAEMGKLRARGYKTYGTPLEEGVSAYVQRFLCQDDPYR